MEKERNVNAYGSDGRIYQIEYAMKASSLGTTTIGAKIGDSIVVVSEKKIVSPLQDSSSVKKHYKVYKHVALAFSGISGDARTIVEKARDFCIIHEFSYDELIPVEGILKKLSTIALNFSEEDESQRIFSRPFGISALICGYDVEPRLFLLDPSGTFSEYKAKGIGSAGEAVDNELRKTPLGDLTLNSGVRKTLEIMGSVMKDKVTEWNCEVMICGKEGIRFFQPEEIKEFLDPVH